jgi:serine protease SohB
VAFLTEYGLFLAKTLTLLLAIGAVILMVVSSRQPKSRKGELVVTDLSSELEQGRHQLQAALAGKAERKQMEKTRKAEHKAKAKSEDERSRLFVIDFHGSMDAKEVASLREEVSAVIGWPGPGTRCCCGSNPAAAWCTATAWLPPSCSGCGTRTSR